MNPGSNSRFHDFTAHTAVASKKVLHSFSWQGLRNLNWVWIACSIFIPNPVSLYPAAGMAYAGPSGMSAFKGELRFYDGDRNIVHGMPLHFQSGIFPEELAVVFNDHRHANQAPMQPILLVQDPVRNLYVPEIGRAHV